MARQKVTVTVTGSAGQIGYALLFRIASGEMFGPSTEVHLRLLELEAALPALGGVRMELEDCAFPLLGSVVCTANLDEAFKGADWALLIGSVPRKKGMERSDLLRINGPIFVGQGKAIAQNANADCRTFVVGNPCNTNALIARHAAGGKSRHFYAMTMLDQNRAASFIAQKANTSVGNIKKLAVWGNHSTTMVPDFTRAEISGKKLTEVITDRAWLEGDFFKSVQDRGAKIIEARGLSSAASAANAVIDSVKALRTPAPEGEFFSVGVPGDGSYGFGDGLIFSYPISSDGKDWKVVHGLDPEGFIKEKIAATADELIKEREAVAEFLR